MDKMPATGDVCEAIVHCRDSPWPPAKLSRRPLLAGPTRLSVFLDPTITDSCQYGSSSHHLCVLKGCLTGYQSHFSGRVDSSRLCWCRGIHATGGDRWIWVEAGHDTAKNVLMVIPAGCVRLLRSIPLSFDHGYIRQRGLGPLGPST